LGDLGDSDARRKARQCCTPKAHDFNVHRIAAPIRQQERESRQLIRESRERTTRQKKAAYPVRLHA
jgi:hypothetical protein